MKRHKKRLLRSIRNLILTVIILLLVVASIICFNGYKLYKTATDEISIDDKILEIRNNNDYISIDQISQNYINAVIAVEDHRFYLHKGIDIISIANAAFSDIKTNSLGMGGSSITQQLAKNMYFSQDKNFARKVAEVFVSIDLERKLSKDEILELYANIIYFGDGYYGINNASHGYYNKEANNLSLEEAIMLAGLPAAPSVYSPTINEKLAMERYHQVEAAMIKYGYIKKES